MPYLKQIIIYFIRLILKIFYICPIKKDRIVFFSFNGEEYSCNPKYIFEYLNRNFENRFQYVWVFNNVDKYKFLEDMGISIVRKNSFMYFYYILTSKIIISNNLLSSYFPLREEQIYIETWHGGGAYKKTGKDIYKSKLEIQRMKYISSIMTAFISSSKRVTETKSQGHMIPLEKFWECGMPRNDLLFSPQPNIIKKVKEFYQIEEKIKIVLYAPTFRWNNEFVELYYNLNINKCLNALSSRFGGKWVLFFRTHHSIKENVDLEHAINVSDYEDMQELLCASDVLITDYSSCMWDFSLTKKPCFVFAPDIKQYKQECDFFTPISEWPYPIAENNNELVNNILNFNELDYQTKVSLHHNKQGSFDTGHATEFIANKILKITKLKGDDK